MLATLERPIDRFDGPKSPPSARSAPSAPPDQTPLLPSAEPAHPRLRSLVITTPPRPPAILPIVLDRPPVSPVVSPRPTRALAPVRQVAPQRTTAQPAARLRMTMRARRLLAGLVLFCAAAIGVVAVDLLAEIIPTGSGTSYAAQEEAYVVEAPDGSGGLVPSAGSSITVGAGDTLWSIAEHVDPASDPRDVIAAIMTLNELTSSRLEAGQLLLLP